MAEQYIFTIENLTKAYGKREVLKNIWLSFYPGAKIGVIGGNGAGKSTLLRIMAGVETGLPRHGPPDARLHHRLRAAGAAPRRIDRRARQHRTGRRRHPRPADAAGRARQQDGRGVGRRDGRRPGGDEQGPGRHRRRQRLGPRPPARNRHGRHAPAARRRQADHALRRRAPPRRPCARCCCRSPTCCCSTSRPTTSTPSRSPGSNGTLQEYPGTVVAVTHDRYFLDNVAQWILELDRGHGIPWKGNYSVVAGAEAGPAGQGGEAGVGPAQGAGPRAGVGEDGAAGPGGQEQGPPERLRKAGQPGIRGDARTSWSCRSRRGRTWATSWCGPRTSARATATTC